MQKVLNAIGLGLGIIGSYMMYHFSPKINSQTILYQKEEMKELLKKDAFSNKMVRVGMFLLFLSFLCQALALFDINRN